MRLRMALIAGSRALSAVIVGGGFMRGLSPNGLVPVSAGIRCYHCESMETCKAGFSRFNGREKQRYFCRSCRRYFRENLEMPRVDPATRNFWARTNLPSAGHLILELRALAQHLGRTPKVYDVSERSKQRLGYSLNTYRAVFGTLSEAFRRAKLSPDYPRQYSPEKMIAELRELRKKLGRPLTVGDIEKASKKGKAPSGYFLKRAFGSTTKAINATDAGQKVYTRDEIITWLIRLDSTLDHRIMREDINELYRQNKGPSYKVVKRMFGSMEKAVRLAGLKKVPGYHVEEKQCSTIGEFTRISINHLHTIIYTVIWDPISPINGLMLSNNGAMLSNIEPMLDKNGAMLVKIKPMLGNNEPMLGRNGAMLVNNGLMLGRNAAKVW